MFSCCVVVVVVVVQLPVSGQILREYQTYDVGWVFAS